MRCISSLRQKKITKSNHILSAMYFLYFLDLSAINSVAVLDTVKYSNYSGFPRLQKWIETMKKLPYYEECTGIPNKHLTVMTQKAINS